MPGADIRRTALPTALPWARIFWEQCLQPLELRRLRPDLLHSLAFVSPVRPPCPAVVTVYDLSFKLTPERFQPAQRLYLSALTARSCHRARRVIAISESTRSRPGASARLACRASKSTWLILASAPLSGRCRPPMSANSAAGRAARRASSCTWARWSRARTVDPGRGLRHAAPRPPGPAPGAGRARGWWYQDCSGRWAILGLAEAWRSPATCLRRIAAVVQRRGRVCLSLQL